MKSILKSSILSSILIFSVLSMMNISSQDVYAVKAVEIEIVNNLEQPLEFKEIKNRQAIKIVSDPPKEILAHSSGSFKVEQGDSVNNEHLNVKYNIEETEDQLGIEFKWDRLDGGTKHCPKDHPNWVTEEVQHCGDWSKGWTYTFSPN